MFPASLKLRRTRWGAGGEKPPATRLCRPIFHYSAFSFFKPESCLKTYPFLIFLAFHTLLYCSHVQYWLLFLALSCVRKIPQKFISLGIRQNQPFSNLFPGILTSLRELIPESTRRHTDSGVRSSGAQSTSLSSAVTLEKALPGLNAQPAIRRCSFLFPAGKDVAAPLVIRSGFYCSPTTWGMKS